MCTVSRLHTTRYYIHINTIHITDVCIHVCTCIRIATTLWYLLLFILIHVLSQSEMEVITQDNRQYEVCHCLSCLPKPQVQRIYDYHRLLVQLFSITSKDHPDYDDLRHTVARVQHVSLTLACLPLPLPPSPFLSPSPPPPLFPFALCPYFFTVSHASPSPPSPLITHPSHLPFHLSHLTPLPLIPPPSLPPLQMVQAREHQLTQSENESKLEQVQMRFPNDNLFLTENLASMEVHVGTAWMYMYMYTHVHTCTYCTLLHDYKYRYMYTYMYNTLQLHVHV